MGYSTRSESGAFVSAVQVLTSSPRRGIHGHDVNNTAQDVNATAAARACARFEASGTLETIEGRMDTVRRWWRWPTGLMALTVLLVLAMTGQALAPAAVSARRQPGNDVNTEVVGGQPVPQGTFRFMTVVQIQGLGLCGGSLIAPRFVLTAAHCVTDDGDELPADRFTLVVGRAARSDGGNGVVRAAVAVAAHPAWDPVTGANDVAVLKLKDDVPPSIAQPLAVVDEGETRFDSAGQPVVVAGWGRLSQTNDLLPNQLRAANLTVVSDAACGNAYGDDFIQAVMVCAAFSGRDSCQGDSGGPLFAREVIGFDIKKKRKKKGKKQKTIRVPIVRDVQMGIVSFGIGCANPAFPGVYTRLSNPDINEFIADELQS
jgi:secreted trypsin-like serine protease